MKRNFLSLLVAKLWPSLKVERKKTFKQKLSISSIRNYRFYLKHWKSQHLFSVIFIISSYFSLDNKINIVDPDVNQGKSVLFLLLQQRHFDLHLHSIWQTEKAALFLSSEKHVYAVVTHDFLQGKWRTLITLKTVIPELDLSAASLLSYFYWHWLLWFWSKAALSLAIL